MCVAVLLIPPPRGEGGRPKAGRVGGSSRKEHVRTLRALLPPVTSFATLTTCHPKSELRSYRPHEGEGERGVSDRVIPREGESGSIQYAGALQFITGALEYRGLRLRGRRRVLPRQVRRSHQKLIDRPRAQPPLPDRPDDERLAAAHVAGGEYVRPRGLIVCGIGPHICRAGRDRRQASSKRPPAPDAKPIPINRL
jgi:hypothetical protein